MTTDREKLLEWLAEEPDRWELAKALYDLEGQINSIHWPTLIAAVKVTLAIIDERKQTTEQDPT